MSGVKRWKKAVKEDGTVVEAGVVEKRMGLGCVNGAEEGYDPGGA